MAGKSESPGRRDPERLPAHVAFIMDGNGRWATARGKPRASGHRAGAETVRRITTAAREWGIPYITLYAFSTENWNRPKAEVSALMRLLGMFLRHESVSLRKNGIRLNAIGDLAALPAGLRKNLAECVASTASGKDMTLTLALNYGGRDEIVRAAKRVFAKIGSGDLLAEDVNEEAFAACLDTAGLPDPDLVVRTAGENRMSNFLVWQAAYAEFHCSDKCWPDFTADDFALALADYRRRVRTFGGLTK